jgi:hypothetical protein
MAIAISAATAGGGILSSSFCMQTFALPETNRPMILAQDPLQIGGLSHSPVRPLLQAS